jgi:hypothetical protein
MQYIDEQEANSKLGPGTIAFPNQMQDFFLKTKFMQDMDEKGINAKLVLGTIAFQTKCMQNIDKGMLSRCQRQ